MKKERCIICHQETGISEDTPIELRDNYIEGVGQLCPECALKITREQHSTQMSKSIPEYRPYLKQN